MAAGPDPTTICHVLHEDRELAYSIPSGRRDQAVEECTARETRAEPGSWTGPGVFSIGSGIGLLALEGLLIRRVGVEGRFGSELLGEGDLLRPWHGEPSTLPLTTGWSVLAPTRLAILDDGFVPYLSRYPELTGCLVARAIQRSRNLAIFMAIVHQARVDVRLHMLLWHLAGRWGKVRSDGTVLPLRLTHTVLAELVAARRPTVTSALSDLARRGMVRNDQGLWILYGDPPGELIEMGPLRSTFSEVSAEMAADRD